MDLGCCGLFFGALRGRGAALLLQLDFLPDQEEKLAAQILLKNKIKLTFKRKSLKVV